MPEEIKDQETQEELTDEQKVDAELKAEWEKLQSEETDETETEETQEKPEEKEEEGLSEEEAVALIQNALDASPKVRAAIEQKLGVKLPQEEEAEKEGAKQEAKAQTAEEILSGLPDVQLDPEVIALIDKKYGDDPVKRDAMFTQYATRAAMEALADQKATEKVAPILQDRETAMWQATAQATANDIATKASVPDATKPIAEYILSLGNQEEVKQMYAKPALKEAIDAKIRDIVSSVADSLEETEQKEPPTAERTGGGKPDASYALDGMSGEDKKFAEGVKADIASGLLSKKDGDAMLASLRKK